ncbi:MAG TPA: ABC transporter transmembrane domain-containing protein [Chthoniobacterales bacterium]|nr:ABC transporter transmembrane domain-containing protein [Chthoniobacterales bacterium]
MSDQKKRPPKQSIWTTIRIGWRPYKRLYSYVMPYKFRFIVGLAFGFIFGAVTSLLPLVMAKVTSIVFNGHAVSPTALASNPALMTHGPKMSNINDLVLLCLAIPAVMTIRSLCSFANTYYTSWVSNRVLTDIRTGLFAKMISHSMDFFNKAQSGYLMSKITNDTNMMQAALSSVSSDLFKQPVAIIGGIAVLLYMDWKFTIVTLVLFPSCIIPLSMYGKRARKAVKNEQFGLAQMVVTMQETFAGIRVIKSFAREALQAKLFRKSNDAQFSASMRLVRSTEAVGPMIETIAAMGVGLALLYVYVDQLPAAKFIALIGGIFLLYDPIKSLSRIHIIMQRSIQATVEIFGILDSEPSVMDRPGAIELQRAAGQIDFENVSFRYEGGITDAVQNLTLRVEPGRSYALVGASGAGKSTILSLILRLYDPTDGVVRIDGHDLRDISQNSLRHLIGLVSQDTFLFHDTIFSNIQFGRLDATEEEIRAAAVTAYAHDFIMAQPKGYDTIIGDKGCLLSGGQQQRLAIARALLKNAPILLLDEATSALDSESEQQIQIALEYLAKGRTVIAIAHRLSTILSADQIVVMESGHIKEIGTHAELLEKSGYYRRLYDLQFNRNPEEPGAEVEMLETASA